MDNLKKLGFSKNIADLVENFKGHRGRKGKRGGSLPKSAGPGTTNVGITKMAGAKAPLKYDTSSKSKPYTPKPTDDINKLSQADYETWRKKKMSDRSFSDAADEHFDKVSATRNAASKGGAGYKSDGTPPMKVPTTSKKYDPKPTDDPNELSKAEHAAYMKKYTSDPKFQSAAQTDSELRYAAKGYASSATHGDPEKRSWDQVYKDKLKSLRASKPYVRSRTEKGGLNKSKPTPLSAKEKKYLAAYQKAAKSRGLPKANEEEVAMMADAFAAVSAEQSSPSNHFNSLLAALQFGSVDRLRSEVKSGIRKNPDIGDEELAPGYVAHAKKALDLLDKKNRKSTSGGG